jgi:hypothetical protein
MNLKLNPLYKRLVAFLIVIGPIYWLVFTEDGQRRTDSVVLYLWGESEIKLNLQALDNRFTEQDLKKVFPDIEWKCQDQNTDFGNRLCASQIGIYNGIPAHAIAVFFKDRWVNGLRVNYRRIYHDQLIQQLWQQLGSPIKESPTEKDKSGAAAILRWDTGKGNVIVKQTLEKSEAPALLWLPNSSAPHAG